MKDREMESSHSNLGLDQQPLLPSNSDPKQVSLQETSLEWGTKRKRSDGEEQKAVEDKGFEEQAATPKSNPLGFWNRRLDKMLKKSTNANAEYGYTIIAQEFMESVTSSGFHVPDEIKSDIK